MDLCQWVAWESPGPIAGICSYRGNKNSANNSILHVRSYNRWKGKRSHSQVNSSWGEILSGFSPSSSAPILTSLYTDWNNNLETDLYAYKSTHREQDPYMTEQWQSQSKGEAHTISEVGVVLILYQGDNWHELLYQSHPLGTDMRSTRNYNPAVCRERKQKHSKFYIMRWQGNMLQMKEKVKNI